MTAVPDKEEARTATLLRFRSAATQDLLLLALLQDSELQPDLLVALRQACFDDLLGLRLVSEEGQEALTLLRQGLADLPKELTDQVLDILAAEYADIYLNNSFGAFPCESVWIDEEGLTMQEPMFQVREWYRRFGLEVEDWRKRTDDHLVNQLRFLAHMLDSDAGNADLSDAACFLDEHLLRWSHGFAERVGGRCQTRFYSGLVTLAAAYLSELRELLAEATGEPVPSAEEIDERMRPKVGVAVDLPGPYVPGVAPSW
jgi:putative dimethyl sulfoxide reductase chaperone